MPFVHDVVEGGVAVRAHGVEHGIDALPMHEQKR